jgi:hypothetical protein
MKFREKGEIGRPHPKVGEFWMAKYSYLQSELFWNRIRRIQIIRFFPRVLDGGYAFYANVYSDEGVKEDGLYSFKVSELIRRIN